MLRMAVGFENDRQRPTMPNTNRFVTFYLISRAVYGSASHTVITSVKLTTCASKSPQELPFWSLWRISQAVLGAVHHIFHSFDLRPEEPEVHTIKTMVIALKSATEACLGTALNTTVLSAPITFRGHNRGQLRSAISGTGFQLPLVGISDTHSLSSVAYGIGSCSPHTTPYKCDWEAIDSETVLAVEYSKATLSLTLLAQDRGVEVDLRKKQDVELGAGAKARIHDEASYWTNVREMISEVIKLPILASSPDFNAKDEISQLILIGDSVTDDRFLQVLVEALGGQALLTSLKTREEIINPVFAAARGAAIIAKSWIEEAEKCLIPRECNDPTEREI